MPVFMVDVQFISRTDAHLCVHSYVIRKNVLELTIAGKYLYLKHEYNNEKETAVSA